MSGLKNDLPKKMRAAVVTGYGGPELIKIMDVPLPVLKEGMVMVRVEASAVNSADVRTRALRAEEPVRTLMRMVLGFRRPRRPILGTVYAGSIAAVGEGVTTFKVGDRVFGATPGMSFACHAQYVAVPEKSAMALMPETGTAAEMVSLVFGGSAALFFLEKAKASPGKKALIYGASGAVGSMAVQVARNLGMHVSGVASAKNEDLLTALGAEHFLDYTHPGFQLPQGQYDLLFDAVGKLSGKLARQALKPGGVYTTVAGMAVSRECKRHLELLADWYVSDKLQAVIQECVPFADIVKAHHIVDTGHKRGSIVLLMGQEEDK